MMAMRSVLVAGVAVLAMAGAALAEGDNDVRVTVNGRGWNATPVDFSDGRSSVIIVPEAADPTATQPQAAPTATDAAAAITLYLQRAGRTCTIDGTLYVVGPMVTGTRDGWTARLSCKA
ncbi:MAG TPA: hypothetical protein VHL34_21360 [Rhizomicrobium sp.]|jgi:hypothetical protein|nr:hypothetical protein [Rhizomicrobium sp.]